MYTYLVWHMFSFRVQKDRLFFVSFFASKKTWTTDTNDYTVVSFSHILPEEENGWRVNVDSSIAGFGNFLAHESYRVSYLNITCTYYILIAS